MSHPDRQPQLVDRLLQILLENMSAAAIASTAIAQQQQLAGFWIQPRSILFPVEPETVAGKLTRVVTNAERDVPDVTLQIVQPIIHRIAR